MTWVKFCKRWDKFIPESIRYKFHNDVSAYANRLSVIHLERRLKKLVKDAKDRQRRRK